MLYTILCILCLALLSCKHGTAQTSSTLNEPKQQFTLPAILNEVSGVTNLDNSHLAMVQDEKGIVFIFHLPSGKIINQFPFDSVGDYEGLAFADPSLFILRSDGRLTEWKNFDRNSGGGEIKHYPLPVQTKDNEGLCYDKQNKRLLIAAKSKPNDPAEKSARYIYSFDLASQELLVDKKYSIHTEELGTRAKELGARTWKMNSKGKAKTYNFRPSDLAIHPETGQLYIISATDQLLVITDKNGEIKNIQTLSANLFRKPEGITFLDDGKMIISNEADGQVATMLIWE